MRSEPSLFRHLCERPSRLENTLTDGLAYLIRTRTWAVQALRVFFDQQGFPLEPDEFECKSQYRFDDGSRPDIALTRRSDHSISALLELKIDAILTPNQPIGYLRRIVAERLHPNDGGEIVLFVVPSTRLRTVWKEINHRLSASGLGCRATSRYCLESEQAQIAIVSWDAFLNGIQDGVVTDPEAKEMFSIMKQKTEKLEQEIPEINPKIIGNTSIALDVLHYMRITETIIDKINSASDETFDELHKRTDKDAMGGYTYTGQYYRLYEYNWFWIGFDPESWSKHPISPIWIWIENNDSSIDLLSPLKPPFSRLEADGKAFFETDPRPALKIPLELNAGCKGDELVSQALKQISYVLMLIADVRGIGLDSHPDR